MYNQTGEMQQNSEQIKERAKERQKKLRDIKLPTDGPNA